MKLKKILRNVGFGFIVVVIVLSLGFVVWAKTGTLESRETAAAALISSDSITITQDRWIVFEPVAYAEIGLIFYPGGLVDPKAYAPILRKIADEGIFVIITPMPLNLAIFNTNAANEVIDNYPQISKWIIAGHSLGGAAAAIYANDHPDRIDAIVLWDSYPADSADLSDNTIYALSIYGTSDAVPNTENFNEKKFLMPQDTFFVGIEGANHAQFGDYGPQKGDVDASISLGEQHIRVAQIMIDFISNLE